MAEPQLQIEKRVERLEKAVGTMADWLVQAQTGFGAHDAEGIHRILRGETSQASEESDSKITKDETDSILSTSED